MLQKIGNSRDRAVKKTGEGLLQLLRGEGALGLRPAVRAPPQQADAGGPVEGVVRPGRDPLKVVTGGHSAGQKGVPPQVGGVAAEQDGGLAKEDGELLRTDFTVREENGILVVTLLAECREQIGRVVEFEGQVGHILPGAGT